MRIDICVGSSCHLKGSHEVVHIFQEAIAKNFLQNDVLLAASFCLGNCANGVSVLINGELISNVYPENAEEIFNEKVLKVVKG